MKHHNDQTTEKAKKEKTHSNQATAMPKAQLAASRRAFIKKGLLAAAFVPPAVHVFSPDQLDAKSQTQISGCKHFDPMPTKGKDPFCRGHIGSDDDDGGGDDDDD